MKPRRGFSLIELLVVIAIVGLLASLVLPGLGRAKRTALCTSCLSNLHQIGLALDLYVQENNDYLPSCAQLLSVNTNLPSITAVLGPYLKTTAVFQCPEDHQVFPNEQTSYEWNLHLNGASYSHPEDWTPATREIVEVVFGGRLNTPLVGDAEAFHPASGAFTGKNALYFEGRVQRSRVLAF
ncbi:MAG TPA: type II secretion system protein [Candidatus Acidoferrum sp.]|nr:type II secretion system protein [Candidatus Acidoferrum sp.]